ncbi:MAG TPA: HepT-like ribonuclease domain-containing protein [Roseiarcus sp.]|nr:HepT-like ribonuclease domain-containing protein [Roseiarcus sp.]
MPSKQFDPKATLFHIRDNVTLALSFVEGFDYQRFCADTRTIYAVTRALEIISEASRRLPVAIKQRHPASPWVDIAGAGSVYRHDYEDVRERRLWSTLQKDLAPLLAVVEQELRDLGELP